MTELRVENPVQQGTKKADAQGRINIGIKHAEKDVEYVIVSVADRSDGSDGSSETEA